MKLYNFKFLYIPISDGQKKFVMNKPLMIKNVRDSRGTVSHMEYHLCIHSLKCSISHHNLQCKTAASAMHSYPCVIHIKILCPLQGEFAIGITYKLQQLLYKIGFV